MTDIEQAREYEVERVADAMASDNTSEEIFWRGNNVEGMKQLARVAINAMQPAITDLHQRLDVATEALRWQPIETAPHDQLIVGRDGGFVCTVIYRDIYTEKWMTPTTTGWLHILTPTQWMPTPTP